MKRWPTFAALVSALAIGSGANAAGLPSLQEKPEARLDKTSVPAQGAQDARLMVSGFGRYSLTVKSAQGTSLQLIDHQSGPGEVSGAAGSEDGRLDLFLDRGTYKVRTVSSDKGEGEAALEAHAFRELNGPQPARLVDYKLVSETLGDFDQRSYWIQIEATQQVQLEATGRYLADLRLWKDGTWLVDSAPETEVIEPKSGQPMQSCRLSLSLGQGLYLLTAYGGKGQAWANDDGAKPFYLRMGIPLLSEAGRTRHVMSPFGVDRWRVPSKAAFFRLELPESRPATIEVNSYSGFDRGGNSAEITKDSRLPVAEINWDGGGARNVTVRAEAGRPYILQHFGDDPSSAYSGRAGNYWLTTVHSGDPGDSIDATAMLTRDDADPKKFLVHTSNAVEVDLGNIWARRFNSLETSSVFLHISKPSVYAIVSREAAAVFRIEPYFIAVPEKYQQPPSKPSGSTWELDPGYYVLTIDPVDKGILSVAFCAARMRGEAEKVLGDPAALMHRPFQPFIQIPKIAMDKKRSYRLHRNLQPGVNAGVVLRKLPLDLTDALPFMQPAGTTIPVPFEVKEDGTLSAEDEAGGKLEVSVDNGPWQTSVEVGAGNHAATVRGSGTETLRCSLLVVPRRLRTDMPLPPLPETALASLPVFPVLSDGNPKFFDLGKSGEQTFLVEASGPGLYQLQTTGILSTAGRLRTRTVPALFAETSNGVGRNFLIQQYLREGTYQVSVSAQDETYGHLGLELKRSEIIDGGQLVEGIPARIELPAGSAVAYVFNVAKETELRLQSIGLGRNFRCRLEDSEGWPVAEPDSPADLRRSFEPGSYRLILLPDSVASRRLTLLEAVEKPLAFEGHGPHKLPLARRVSHQWLEPAEGADRTPDVWEFEMPGPADVTVGVSSQMAGRLVRVEAGGKAVEEAAVPIEGWHGRLEAGTHRLELRCARVNNRVDYEVEVRPTELLAGRSIEVSAPMSVPVSVGEGALVELSSFGSVDVRARLYDEKGTLVAESDDRPQDWNFQILQRLAPGRYRLEVQPVGTESAECTVTMRLPREVAEPPMALPSTIELAVGLEAHLVPLDAKASTGLLLLAAESPEMMGCSLETSEGAAWQPLATAVSTSPRLEIPLSGSNTAKYRLRVWSLDGRGSKVHLHAAAATPAILSESEAALGVTLEAVPGSTPALGAVAVKVERAGVFQLGRGPVGARVSSARGEACHEVPGGLFAADEMLWIVGALETTGQGAITRVQVVRSRVEAGVASPTLLLPESGRATWDLAAGERGPVLAMATSMSGLLGTRVIDRTSSETTGPSGKTMAVGGRSTLSVNLAAEQPAAMVWRSPGATEKTEVRLSQWRYAVPAVKAANPEMSGSLKGVRAEAYELASGAKRIQMSLGTSIVAVLSEGDQVRSVHWNGGQAFSETLDADGNTDRLTLLHMRDAEDLYTVELVPADPKVVAPLLIGPLASLEVEEPTAGRLRIAVRTDDGDTGAQLHLRGAIRDVVLVGDDGSVRHGADLTNIVNGVAIIDHGRGAVLGWIEREGEGATALWDQNEDAATFELTPPAVIALQGQANSLRVVLAQPAVLHVRSSTPAIARLRRETGPGAASAQLNGVSLDVYAPAGPLVVDLRGVAGRALTGTATVTVSEVIPADEGLGAEILLPPGGTRFHSFHVTEAGPVGIGVRTDSGSVECELLDENGNSLGTGVVQMPELKPGTYFVRLHAVEDGPPARARVALAGLKLPGTGPPEDIIRSYLRPAAPAAAESDESSDPGEEEDTDGEVRDEEGDQP